MYGSVKGDMADAFAHWLAENAKLNTAWGNLSTAGKQAELAVLIQEQDGLCVYCGRRLELERDNQGQPQCHLEHFRPRAAYPDLTFDHNNLFVSCGPAVAGDRPSDWLKTCGIHKGDAFDESLHVPPDRDACQARFKFSTAGHVVSDENDAAAHEMIRVLNLNAPHLVRERSDLVSILSNEVARALQNGVGGDVIATSILTDREGATASFAHMRKQLFDDFLKLGEPQPPS